MADKKPGTAVVKTVRGEVERAREQIAKVLPAHMDVDKVITGVRLAVAQNPNLNACRPETVVFSVMAACQLGLEINSPLHHCSLVPFKDECTLMIEYRGYQELARRGGEVRNIEARCVYAGDVFDYQLGTDPKIVHTPKGETDDKVITHAYAIAFDKAGRAIAFDVLRRDEIEAARNVSRMKGGAPWTQWYGEMARKTAVRRLAKYLPLSPEMAAAIEMDIRGDTGEVGAPIQGIDSPARLNAGVADKTAAALDELKQVVETPAKAEPAAAATGDEPAW